LQVPKSTSSRQQPWKHGLSPPPVHGLVGPHWQFGLPPWHTPLTHMPPGPQSALVTQVAVPWQKPATQVCPGRQGGLQPPPMHWPPEQPAPPHESPQPPQLAPSLLVSTQAPLQQLSGDVQAALAPHWQLPPAQLSASVGSQPLPQLPQLLRSLSRLRQPAPEPGQHTSGDGHGPPLPGHEQTPLMQVSFAPHLWPHAPQFFASWACVSMQTFPQQSLAQW
jgi:hypothetical protein